MKGMKNISSFNIFQLSRSQYRLFNGNTKKYDNHEVGKQCCSPKDHGTARDRLVRTVNWT